MSTRNDFAGSSSTLPESSPDPKPTEDDNNKEEELPRNDFAPVRWVSKEPTRNENEGEATSSNTDSQQQQQSSTTSLSKEQEEHLRYLQWKQQQEDEEKERKRLEEESRKEAMITTAPNSNNNQNGDEEEELDIEDVKRRRREQQQERERREAQEQQQQQYELDDNQQQRQIIAEQQEQQQEQEHSVANNLLLDEPVFDYQDTDFLSTNFFEQFTVGADEDDEEDFAIRQALFLDHVLDLKKTEQQLKFQALQCLHSQFGRVKIWFSCLAAKRKTEWLELEARWVLMSGFHAMNLRIKKRKHFSHVITRNQRKYDEAEERRLVAAQEQAQVRAVQSGVLANEPRTLACALQIILEAQDVRDRIRADEKESRRKLDNEFRASQYAARIHELDRENLVVLAARDQRKKRWEQYDPFLVRRRMPVAASAAMVFVPAPPEQQQEHHQKQRPRHLVSQRKNSSDPYLLASASSVRSGSGGLPMPSNNIYGGGSRQHPGVFTIAGSSAGSSPMSSTTNKTSRPHSSPVHRSSNKNKDNKKLAEQQQQSYNRERPQSSGGGKAVVRPLFENEKEETEEQKRLKQFNRNNIGTAEAEYLAREDRNTALKEMPPHRSENYKNKAYVRGFAGGYDQEWYPNPPPAKDGAVTTTTTTTRRRSSATSNQQVLVPPQRGANLTETTVAKQQMTTTTATKLRRKQGVASDEHSSYEEYMKQNAQKDRAPAAAANNDYEDVDEL